MKVNKLFENEDVNALCKKYDIRNYTINPDGTVDVAGDVSLSHKGLTEIPIRFNYVSGSFWCQSNQLTSLKGCPMEVSGSFNCQNNNLTSLVGAPKAVGGSVWVGYNDLTSLVGSPREVGGGFNCCVNQLTSLQGAPREVGYSFFCWWNNFTSEPDHSFINIGDDFIWTQSESR